MSDSRLSPFLDSLGSKHIFSSQMLYDSVIFVPAASFEAWPPRTLLSLLGANAMGGTPSGFVSGPPTVAQVVRTGDWATCGCHCHNHNGHMFSNLESAAHTLIRSFDSGRAAGTTARLPDCPSARDQEVNHRSRNRSQLRSWEQASPLALHRSLPIPTVGKV